MMLQYALVAFFYGPKTKARRSFARWCERSEVAPPEHWQDFYGGKGVCIAASLPLSDKNQVLEISGIMLASKPPNGKTTCKLFVATLQRGKGWGSDARVMENSGYGDRHQARAKQSANKAKEIKPYLDKCKESEEDGALRKKRAIYRGTMFGVPAAAEKEGNAAIKAILAPMEAKRYKLRVWLDEISQENILQRSEEDREFWTE